MKASWTFLAGLGAGFLLMFGLTATAFYLNLGVPGDSSRWAFELNLKKRLLANQTASPKLLVVGGSATLFGLSAREIQKQTGWRTINMGTHAALGTAYILHLAQEAAKPGDTVLLVLEYELYNYGKVKQTWADKLLVDYLVSRDPAFFHSLSPPEQWTVFMLTSFSRLVQGLKDRWRAERPYDDSNFGAYRVRYLNESGDQTHHIKAVRPPQRNEVLEWKSALARGMPEHPEGFSVLTSFCAWARTNQVRILATYPNICDQPGYHEQTAKQVAQTIKDFFSRLNVPVIGDYTDALLPRDQSFDTNYHPTEEAALARTQRLIPKLNAALTAAHN